MAAIGKIREKSTLLLVIIGLALAAFILGDLFNSSGSRDVRYVGEIDGNPILPQEYNSLVEYTENRIESNNNTSLTEQQRLQIKEQVWNDIIEQNLIFKRCEDIGLTISEEESDDLMYGRFIHESFYQYFGDRDRPGYVDSNFADSLNPTKLDGAKVKAYYDYYQQAYNAAVESNNGAQARESARILNYFNQTQQDAIKERIKSKYFNLIKKGMYVTGVEAQADNMNSTSKVDARIVGKRYDQIPDSTISLTEEEIQNYYEENIEDYPQDIELRNLAYVKFDILPSAKDTADAMNEIIDAKDKLSKSSNDDDELKTLRDSKSNKKYAIHYFKEDELASKLEISAPYDSIIFNNTSKDSVVGPFIDAIPEEDGSVVNYYKIAKVVGKEKRADSLKLRFMLIAHKDLERVADSVNLTLDQAKLLADSLITEIKRDSSKFGDLNIQFSNDANKQVRKGNSMWYADNLNMPKEVLDIFERFVYSPVGTIDTIMSPAGIQIIQLTDKTNPTEKVKLATINKRIFYSSDTKKIAKKKANEILDNIESIEAYQEYDFFSKGIFPQNADNLSSTSFGIGTVKDSRRIVEWAFNAEIGETEVKNLNDSYIFTILTDIKEEGYKTLDDVRMEVEGKLRIEKKAEMILSEVGELADINAYAKAFEANIDSVKGQSFKSNYIQNVGSMEYDLIGALFAYDEGETSKPIKAVNGVYVFVVDKKYEAVEITDIEQNKANLLRSSYYTIENDVYNAIKNKTEIIDNRIYINN